MAPTERSGRGVLGPLRDDRGTVAMMAVIALLILGILAVSFTTLGSLEVRIGLNDAWEKKAVMVAEAGIAAARNQIENPPSYTAVLGHQYTCLPGGCTCAGTGCGTARLASVATGEFTVRVDNDPDELAGPNPAVDANQRVVLTSVGVTRDGTGRITGRARVRAWITNDDPWKHVCATGDGVLCIDSPPNNANADITPDDPNHMNGPRTYPLIPVPNQIRTTPVYCDASQSAVYPPVGCPPIGIGGGSYPVPAGVTIPAAPRGPSVMYPYYLKALTTPCDECNPATIAYDPTNATCASPATGKQCLGMVRVGDTELRASGGNPSYMVVPGGVLGLAGASPDPATLYIFGKLDAKSTVGTINGTIILHGGGDAGQGGAQTDLAFQGPHTVTTQGPACPDCAHPLAILGYNPNEPEPNPCSPTAQTIYLDISNNGVIINGITYTGGTVDFGPNSTTGAILGCTVHANNAATEFTYNPVYEPAVPPPGFSTPAVTLPSVIATGTWIQCRRADALTASCD